MTREHLDWLFEHLPADGSSVAMIYLRTANGDYVSLPVVLPAELEAWGERFHNAGNVLRDAIETGGPLHPVQ